MAVDRFFGPDALQSARAWLSEQGVTRPMVLCGPSRRFFDAAALPGDVGVFDGAKVHVPREVVAKAREALLAHRADGVVTLGGGSATGLGKALMLEGELPFLAIPTTYAGSEMTSIYGITQGDDKQTGRDERVRPGAVAYVPEFLAALPHRLTIQSLLNALAHPISAGGDSPVVAKLFRAVLQLAEQPTHTAARLDAARAASDAARVLEQGALGVHHKVAHLLGGRFGLPHAPLHAVLLPHSMGDVAAPEADPPAALFDALRIVDAPTSLAALGLDPKEAVALVRDKLGDVSWIEAAALGRRPSIHVSRQALSGGPPLAVFGDVASATDVVLAIHGRGSTADAMVQLSREVVGDAPGVAIVAPQAHGTAWYSASYRDALAVASSEVEVALHRVEAAREWAAQQAPEAKLHVLGFSQGACLALEFAARTTATLRSVVAIAGARPGPAAKQKKIGDAVAGVSVVMGAAAADKWLDADAVATTAAAFESAGARPHVVSEPGDAHQFTARQRITARETIVGRAPNSWGFGNAHRVEALAGALPETQNSPRRGPYGLYPEQVNGTAMVAPRSENLRSWLYRVRPAAGRGSFHELDHPTLSDDFGLRRPEVNLSGWRPLPIPEAPTDFVDGLHTFGGQGSASARRGFAIHLYAANRSMEHRSFYNADGDLLIVPETGALVLQTDLGVLDVPPGHVAIIPRGVVFRVLLADGVGRGYVGEVFGRHFVLPGRGVVGANGLADERHFRAPRPWFEDRLDAGHRLAAKHGGRLYESTIDHSPFDVVAWHGNYTPYAYDLSKFAPVSYVAFDHVDPSAYLVLTSPMDEHGSDSLDLVVFPRRWDVTKNTFRPAFFHRNAVTEYNGIVRITSSASSPFRAGMSFLTPAMTAHGVVDRSVERAMAMSDEKADAPELNSGNSIWFQFETSAELSLTSWAASTELRIEDWPHVWGRYRSYYRPGG